MTRAQDTATTWRPERRVRWDGLDLALETEARQTIARREGSVRRSSPVATILLVIAWLGPLIGAAMLLGTWAGRFEAAISVPGAAIGCVIGAIVDGFVLRHERKHPQDRVFLYSWVLPLAATVATVFAVIRAVDEQLDPAVTVVSLALILAATVALWIMLVRRYRLPRVAQEDRTDRLRRNPVAEAAMRDDLAATVAIYRERGLITEADAQRAIALGPGRLGELDR